MKKFLCFLMLSSLLFAGCQENTGGEPDPREDPPPLPVQIPIRIATGIASRATDTAFDAGDVVGLYVVSHSDGTALMDSGNHVNNLSFTFDGSQWKSSSDVFWVDQQSPADFYCYYPYRSDLSQVKAIPVEVLQDQTSEVGYRAGDFLWGKRTDVAPTSSPVELQVHHLMSNLLVYLEPGRGYNPTDSFLDTIESVRICGTRTHGSVDLSTGMITATGEPADISPFLEGDHYRAMVVPQTLSSTVLVSLQVDGSTYTLSPSITFEPGKQHKCTLTVNKTSEGINIGIAGWDTDNNDYGGVVN